MTEENKRPLLDHLCGDMTPDDRRNLNRANLWLFLWLVTFAAITFLLKGGSVPTGPVGWIVAAIPMVTGLAAMLAYGRYIANADEMQRRIQLQALGVGFGVAFFFGFGYRLLEKVGAPAAEISDVSIVLMLFYFVGLWLGRRRYA
jgi:hypothetical protein